MAENDGINITGSTGGAPDVEMQSEDTASMGAENFNLRDHAKKELLKRKLNETIADKSVERSIFNQLRTGFPLIGSDEKEYRISDIQENSPSSFLNFLASASSTKIKPFRDFDINFLTYKNKDHMTQVKLFVNTESGDCRLKSGISGFDNMAKIAKEMADKSGNKNFDVGSSSVKASISLSIKLKEKGLNPVINIEDCNKSINVYKNLKANDKFDGIPDIHPDILKKIKKKPGLYSEFLEEYEKDHQKIKDKVENVEKSAPATGQGDATGEPGTTVTLDDGVTETLLPSAPPLNVDPSDEPSAPSEPLELTKELLAPDTSLKASNVIKNEPVTATNQAADAAANQAREDVLDKSAAKVKEKEDIKDDDDSENKHEKHRKAKLDGYRLDGFKSQIAHAFDLFSKLFENSGLVKKIKEMWKSSHEKTATIKQSDVGSATEDRDLDDKKSGTVDAREAALAGRATGPGPGLGLGARVSTPPPQGKPPIPIRPGSADGTGALAAAKSISYEKPNLSKLKDKDREILTQFNGEGENKVKAYTAFRSLELGEQLKFVKSKVLEGVNKEAGGLTDIMKNRLEKSNGLNEDQTSGLDKILNSEIFKKILEGVVGLDLSSINDLGKVSYKPMSEIDAIQSVGGNEASVEKFGELFGGDTGQESLDNIDKDKVLKEGVKMVVESQGVPPPISDMIADKVVEKINKIKEVMPKPGDVTEAFEEAKKKAEKANERIDAESARNRQNGQNGPSGP